MKISKRDKFRHVELDIVVKQMVFQQALLDLQRKFPVLYRHFKEGNFVAKMTGRSASGIGFDQALEQVYNYSAKAVGGIIVVTRQKKSVALWDILKHEKDQYTSTLKEFLDIEEDGELNTLHHEFSITSSKRGRDRVPLLIDYLKSVNFSLSRNSGMELYNIVTKENISNSEYLLNMKEMGEELRNEFVNERLLEKTKGLHATLSTIRSCSHQMAYELKI